MKNLIHKLRGELHENYPLANLTSWQIGGPAKFFYRPADLEDFALFLKTWTHEPIIVLGSGTNVLISDKGISGTVVYLREKLNKIEQLDDFTLRAEAGVSCARLVQYSAHQGYIDAVFLAGIPGTLGGLLAMNAGAYGDTIWNHVTQVETINRQGEIKIRDPKEFIIGYRKISGLNITNNVNNEWFVAANLVFAKDASKNATQKVKELLQKRKASHPSQPSCGSVFKNPPGEHAARLIESCGLKGKIIGGAQISEKHANFIVNLGTAKAADVERLIQEIISEVQKKFGITLETEVKFI